MHPSPPPLTYLDSAAQRRGPLPAPQQAKIIKIDHSTIKRNPVVLPHWFMRASRRSRKGQFSWALKTAANQGGNHLAPSLRTDMCYQAHWPGPEGPASPLLGPEVRRVCHTPCPVPTALATRPDPQPTNTIPHCNAGDKSKALWAQRSAWWLPGEAQAHRATSPLGDLK